jgi:hypothetical protein
MATVVSTEVGQYMESEQLVIQETVYKLETFRSHSSHIDH